MATIQPRRKPVVQKIVIPSGLVRPNETVVIEVPSNLKRHAVVVATRPHGKAKDQTMEGYGDEYTQEYVPALAMQPEEEAYQEVAQEEQPYDAMYDISQAEKVEREMLFRNLIEFHRARRNVFEGAKNIFSRSFTTGEVAPFDTAVGQQQAAVYTTAYQPTRYYDTASYSVLPPKHYSR